MAKPMATRSGLLAVAVLAAFVGVVCSVLYSRSWQAQERRWRKGVAFAPEIQHLLRSEPLYRSVQCGTYQIGGPAEIVVRGTLESEAQLAELMAQIEVLDPPVPIDYDIIVTDLLRQGRQLAADLAKLGLEPDSWVINPEMNGTFALAYRSKQIGSLSPLAGKPVYALFLRDSPVEDLSPLEGVSLEVLAFDAAVVRHGIDVIRDMPTLKQINDIPAEEFWRQYEEAEQDESTVPSEAAPSASSTVR